MRFFLHFPSFFLLIFSCFLNYFFFYIGKNFQKLILLIVFRRNNLCEKHFSNVNLTRINQLFLQIENNRKQFKKKKLTKLRPNFKEQMQSLNFFEQESSQMTFRLSIKRSNQIEQERENLSSVQTIKQDKIKEYWRRNQMLEDDQSDESDDISLQRVTSFEQDLNIDHQDRLVNSLQQFSQSIHFANVFNPQTSHFSNFQQQLEVASKNEETFSNIQIQKILQYSKKSFQVSRLLKIAQNFASSLEKSISLVLLSQILELHKQLKAQKWDRKQIELNISEKLNDAQQIASKIVQMEVYKRINNEDFQIALKHLAVIWIRQIFLTINGIY